MDFSFYAKRFNALSPQVSAPPDKGLFLSVVIPSFKEPQLKRAIASIQNCKSPKNGVEVIVVINQPENASKHATEVNNKSIAEAKQLAQHQQQFPIHIIKAFDLPKKHAGVGFARKIGMDEAAYRFSQINRDGVLICFDGDSICDTNYLLEIEKAFANHKTNGASIHFEHPLDGEEFQPSVYNHILEYELHLRYYKQGLMLANHPFAFHTIGSSMAVRASAYLKQGGMNKRKAGEDFYFLQKIIPMGGFVEVSSTKVIPSPRPSDRVPFGTGKAISNMLTQNATQFYSYNFAVFKRLKGLIEGLLSGKTDKFYENDLLFLEQIKWREELNRLNKNTTTQAAFQSQFFRFFNGFICLKYVHFLSENEFDKKPIIEEATKLIDHIIDKKTTRSKKELLELYRLLDRKN